MKKKEGFALLLIPFCTFFMGCANIGSSFTDEINLVDWENVKVFHVENEIPEYVHVADIDFHGISEERSHSEVYDLLKKKVAKIGANAVIIIENAPPIYENSRGFLQEFILWSSVFEPATAIGLASAFSSVSSKDHSHGKAVAIHIYSFE